MIREEREGPSKKRASEHLLLILLGASLVLLFYGIQRPAPETGANPWVNLGLVTLLLSAVLFVAWCYNRFGD